LDAEGLKALFAPFGAVTVKRMFGGHGVYADELCFAIESRGEVFVKVDADNEPEFVAAGSKPFVYEAKGGEMKMAYWLLVAAAYDDEDELKRWAGLGLGAARRAAAAKAKPKPKPKKPK
jgi:DNA transformation protein